MFFSHAWNDGVMECWSAGVNKCRYGIAELEYGVYQYYLSWVKRLRNRTTNNHLYSLLAKSKMGNISILNDIVLALQSKMSFFLNCC